MKRKLPVILAILLTFILAGCVASEPANKLSQTPATGILTKEEAMQIIFSNANIPQADVVDLEIDLDEEDGTIFYDLEFDYEDAEYDYRVDALTGKILYNKAEPKEIIPPAEQPEETQPPVETQPAETTPAETKPKTTTTKKKIGVTAAKNAAFKHANVKSSSAWDVEVDLDNENGKLVYEVSFDAGGYEYDYDIDAYTGKIIRSEKEKND